MVRSYLKFRAHTLKKEEKCYKELTPKVARRYAAQWFIGVPTTTPDLFLGERTCVGRALKS
jgi:hypothetical protein